MNEIKKCTICNFDRGISSHHIIKRIEGGSNEEENLTYLCPNHHWLADFGTKEERHYILEEIKKINGKSGQKISNQEKEILENKIRVLLEDSFSKGNDKPFTEEEWKNHKKSWNYDFNFQMLLGRGCTEFQSKLLHKRSEILILIKKLKQELNTTHFKNA